MKFNFQSWESIDEIYSKHLENIVETEENAYYHHFLLLHTFF